MEAPPQISRAEEQFDALFAELIQKGRATEADYDRATDDLATGATTEASLVAQWSPYALDVGCRVCLRGLEGRADLNGMSGTITGYTLASKRYSVRLDASSKAIAVRANNVERTGDGDVEATVEALSEAVGRDSAEHIANFLICARCNGPCTPNTKCRVPHPPHLTRIQCVHTCPGPEPTIQRDIECIACGQGYAEVEPLRLGGGEGSSAPPKILGPRWCYVGEHSSVALPSGDQRRVNPNHRRDEQENSPRSTREFAEMWGNHRLIRRCTPMRWPSSRQRTCRRGSIATSRDDLGEFFCSSRRIHLLISAIIYHAGEARLSSL